VLEPFNINGSSPQETDEYRLRGFPKGTELYYVRFKRTDVDKALNALETVDRLDLLNNNRIQLTLQNSLLLYELDYQLKCMPIRPNNDFILKHQELKLKGTVSSLLDKQYFNDLRESILYYDGVTWRTSPTAVIPTNSPD
jgi:hypothetical protein